MMLSKHHYARELVKRGNTVYFLNPPTLDSPGTPIISPHKSIEGLYVIDYNTHIKGERKLPLWVLNFLRKKQASKIVAAIGKPIDVVWSFYPTVFFNLQNFDAGIHILHPVDKVLEKKYYKYAKNADVVFSVSDFILNDFAPYNKHCYFINHGLSDQYAEEATKRINQGELTNSSPEHKLRVGYVGNLLRADIDQQSLITVIKKYTDIDFIFWGPYEYHQLQWKHKGDDRVIAFIKFLQESPNVELKGLKAPDVVMDEAASVDFFICCYDPQREINRASNNHKLMEYLSTGKVVVSNFVEAYKDKKSLLEMSEGFDNKDYPKIFEAVTNNLDNCNSHKLRMARINFALQNTYVHQVNRIEKIVNEIA